MDSNRDQNQAKGMQSGAGNSPTRRGSGEESRDRAYELWWKGEELDWDLTDKEEEDQAVSGQEQLVRSRDFSHNATAVLPDHGRPTVRYQEMPTQFYAPVQQNMTPSFSQPPIPQSQATPGSLVPVYGPNGMFLGFQNFAFVMPLAFNYAQQMERPLQPPQHQNSFNVRPSRKSQHYLQNQPSFDYARAPVYPPRNSERYEFTSPAVRPPVKINQSEVSTAKTEPIKLQQPQKPNRVQQIRQEILAEGLHELGRPLNQSMARGLNKSSSEVAHNKNNVKEKRCTDERPRDQKGHARSTGEIQKNQPKVISRSTARMRTKRPQPCEIILKPTHHASRRTKKRNTGGDSKQRKSKKKTAKAGPAHSKEKEVQLIVARIKSEPIDPPTDSECGDDMSFP